MYVANAYDVRVKTDSLVSAIQPAVKRHVYLQQSESDIFGKDWLLM